MIVLHLVKWFSEDVQRRRDILHRDMNKTRSEWRNETYMYSADT